MNELLYRFFVEPRLMGEGVVYAGIHLWYLVASLLLITLGTILLKRSSHSTQHKVIRFILFFSIALEVLKRIRFFAVGIILGQPLFENVMFLLPYHICYINVILLPFAYFYDWKWAKEYLYTMSMFGAAVAILYPYDWFTEPFLKYEIIHEMIYHLPLFFVPFFLMVSGDYRPTWRKVWQVALGVLLCLPLAELGNTIFTNPSYNFMFTRVNPLPINFFGTAHHLFTFTVLFTILMAIYYGLIEAVRCWKRRLHTPTT